MVLPVTQQLIATAQDPSATEGDLQQAADAFLAVVSRTPKSEAEAQLAALAANFDLPDLNRGAFLALIGGAMVEGGCDPQPMAAPLRLRLKAMLEAAARLAEACRARLPERAEDETNSTDTDSAEEEEDDEEDVDEAFEEVRQQVAANMSAENDAWEALRTFWRPGIAVYSVSAMARLAAAGLRPLAEQIAEFHAGGHWLEMILSVLDEEPILVIEPRTRLGMLARISGVVDNFQLNTLLMDGFPQAGAPLLSFLSRRRIPKSVADVARGDGPQQSEEIVTAVWNLYTWQSLLPDLQLPDATNFATSEHWIWNEGSPADIPLFEGRRVILLGPTSYERTWRSQRMFSHLRARIDCERKLTSEEVTSWLQRMREANQ